MFADSRRHDEVYRTAKTDDSSIISVEQLCTFHGVQYNNTPVVRRDIPRRSVYRGAGVRGIL